MKEFRNISDHPENLEDGRVIGRGETFELSAEALESEYNKARIEEGAFTEVIRAKSTRRQKQLQESGDNQTTPDPGNGEGGDDNGGNA